VRCDQEHTIPDTIAPTVLHSSIAISSDSGPNVERKIEVFAHSARLTKAQNTDTERTTSYHYIIKTP